MDQKGDAVVITTGKVRIEISKKTSLFKVINLKDHSVVAEQASPILFEKGKTRKNQGEIARAAPTEEHKEVKATSDLLGN